MTLNSFLTVAAIVAAVFGLAFLLVPWELVGLYGVSLTAATAVIGRIAGSVLIGFAIVFWGARNGNGAEAFKAVMIAGFVANVLDGLILMRATSAGLLNALGWLQVMINGGLAIGFGYFIFGKGKSV